MADEATASGSVEGQVTITHEVGLHARPSVAFTKLAKRFGSEIRLALAEDGPWIDAKSIVKVMAAKAPKGTRLFLRAEGADAQAALDALVALVQRDFDESGSRGDAA